MVSIAYLDDNVVEHIQVKKVEGDTEWQFSNPTEVLAVALDAEPPVTYILVEDDLNWRSSQ
jgi:hypothetical protein